MIGLFKEDLVRMGDYEFWLRLLYHKDHSILIKKEILSKVEGVAFAYFDKGDVVRHKLVKDIIDAYEKFNNNKNGNS